MAGQRQPIELVIAKGKKHLTKAEIEERQRTEVKAAADKVTAPSYLTPSQKKTFKKIVKELRAIDLVSNLDVDALARLVIAQENYVAVTEEMKLQPLTIRMEFKENDADGNPIIIERQVVNSTVERLALLQDRYFKQCRQGAADFGLTVSSRCRLVVPKADKETPKENKFAKFA
nr:MAG: terminase, small subunit [Bacteriophage sp.]